MSESWRDDGFVKSKTFTFRAHRWPIETLAAEALNTMEISF